MRNNFSEALKQIFPDRKKHFWKKFGSSYINFLQPIYINISADGQPIAFV